MGGFITLPIEIETTISVVTPCMHLLNPIIDTYNFEDHTATFSHRHVVPVSTFEFTGIIRLQLASSMIIFKKHNIIHE